MRLEWSKSAALAGLIASMTARLVCGLTLDAAEAGNAAWLAAPVGLALAAPIAWLMCHCPRGARRALAAPLFVGLAMDAAVSIEWTAYSESFLAFDHVAPVWMTLPLLAVILRCAWLGGDAVGWAARLWFLLFAALMLVVVLCQLPDYNPGWLAPWLGGGANAILRQGVRVAGWSVLLAGSALVICEEDLSARDLLPGMLLASLVAALLTALRQMMAPVMLPGNVSRSVRVDALLTNGRAPLYLQLPMIVIWFAGMLQLMSFESVAACGLVRRLLPRASETACMAIGLFTVSALTLTRATRAEAVEQALPYLYHALTAAALITWLMKGRMTSCEKPA